MPSGFEILNQSGGKAKVKLTKPIGWWSTSGEYFTEKIDRLIADGVTDIEVYINSPGGSMVDANEIINQLKRFTGSKTVKLGALCASAATIIACSLDSVEAAQNTQFMIHDPMMTAYIQHLSDFESNKALYNNLLNDAIRVYAAKTGMKDAKLKGMMNKTTWLNAVQAKNQGFVDAIADQDDKMPDGAMDALAAMNVEIPDMVNAAITKEDAEKITEVHEEALREVKEVIEKEENTQIEDMDNAIRTALGLGENATVNDAVNAINALKTAVPDNMTQAIKALGKKLGQGDAFEAVVNESAVAAMLVLASAPLAAPTLEQTTEAPQAAKTEDDGVRMSHILSVLQSGGQAPAAENRDNWDYNQWKAKDPKGLEAMYQNDQEKFTKLYAAR
jgi:ATP-dependent protease ClpP protease subunit